MCVSRVFVSGLNPSYCISNSLCSSQNWLIFTPTLLSGYVPVRAVSSICFGWWEVLHALSALRKNSGGVDLNGWVFAGVHKTILAQEIYCANPNPETNSQSGFQVSKVLGTRVPWSTQEYNIMTVIVIRSLTQPLTCKLGYSIFAAMSWLKVVSITWTSLPIIPSTKSTNGAFFRWSWLFWPCLSFFKFPT